MLEKKKSEVKRLDRLNKNIMIYVIYGLLYDASIKMYKPFASKYLERLGGSELHITLYNSLPGLIGALVLFPASMLISGMKDKKGLTSKFIFFSRLVFLLLTFIPGFPEELQPILFVVLIAIMNLPEAVSQTSMQSLMGDFFNDKVRATAISLKNKFGSLLSMAITLCTGLIITYLPKNNEQRMNFYRIFFLIAFILGLFELRYFNKLDNKNNPDYDEEKDKIVKKPKLQDIKDVFKDKKFMTFAFTTLVYYFSFHAGWAVSSIYQIMDLGATEIWLALSNVISAVASFFIATKWNKLIYKKGNNVAMVFAGFCVALNMLMVGLSPNMYWILAQSAFSGLTVLGMNITLLNGLLENTPDKNRIIYIGIYNTFVNISLGIAPLVTQKIMDMTNVRTSVLIVAGMRFVAAFVMAYILLIRNKESEKV